MAELNPNAELLDLTTKKTTQKIIYNISTSLLFCKAQIKLKLIKGSLNILTSGKIKLKT